MTVVGIGSKVIDETKKSSEAGEPQQQSEVIETHEDNSENDNQVNIENEAKKQGWRPKEEYDGNPNNWRPASEYIERGKIIKENRDNELRDLRKIVLNQTKMLVDMVEEKEKEKISVLSVAKSEAIRAGDEKRADELQNAISQNHQKIEKLRQNPEQEVVKSWNEENSHWANDSSPENKKMTIKMRHYAEEYRLDNPEVPMTEVLNVAKSKIEDEFPHRFARIPIANSRIIETTSVSAASRPSKKGSFGVEDVPVTYRSHVVEFAKRYKMPLDQYIKTLKETGVF